LSAQGTQCFKDLKWGDDYKDDLGYQPEVFAEQPERWSKDVEDAVERVDLALRG
jgi:hypothetical protein